MTISACIESIAAELLALEVLPGSVILAHSSFKSMGYVPGGIETVVQGLLRAIGPRGTLLMPALSWALRPPEIFDVRLTPTNIGAVPEYFRTREGTVRSIHPTHSVCGIGPMSGVLLEDHHRDRSPCGQNSPLNKIMALDAKIVMLGCGLKPNTTMHALEEYVEPPYLYGPCCTYTIKGFDGDACEAEYRTHGFVGYRQRYDRVGELPCTAFLRRGRVLDADTFVLDTRGMREAVLAKLREAPLYFVDKLPADPQVSAQTAS